MLFVQHIEEKIMPLLAARGIKPLRFNFESLNEFLRHPFIQFFTKDKNFERFVICRDKEYELISQLKSGRHYKLGVLEGDIKEIPEWCGQKIIVATKGIISP
jgi:hypothetical protein